MAPNICLYRICNPTNFNNYCNRYSYYNNCQCESAQSCKNSDENCEKFDKNINLKICTTMNNIRQICSQYICNNTNNDDKTAFKTEHASFPLRSDIYYSTKSLTTNGINPNINTTTRTEHTTLSVTSDIYYSEKSAATYGINYNKGDNKTGIIVGGVIGGIVGLVLIGILVYLGFYWRKKKKVVNAIYTEAPYMGSGVYDIDSPSTQPNQARIHSIFPPNHEADSPYDNLELPIVNNNNANDFELAKDDPNYDNDNLGNVKKGEEENEDGEEKKNPYSKVLPPPRHR